MNLNESNATAVQEQGQFMNPLKRENVMGK